MRKVCVCNLIVHLFLTLLRVAVNAEVNDYGIMQVTILYLGAIPMRFFCQVVIITRRDLSSIYLAEHDREKFRVRSYNDQ